MAVAVPFVSRPSSPELFQESQKSGNLPVVRNELKKFKDSYESSVALRSLFLNPVISNAQRDETLMQVFESEGIVSKETQNFIKGAAATKNLNRIKQIVSDFDKLVTFELKEVHASVTSAEPLQPAQLTRLEKALKQRIAADEKLLLVSNVEPNILGGLIVMLDQQLLDLSVAAQVRKIDAAIRT